MNTVIRTDPKFSTALDAVKQMVSKIPDGKTMDIKIYILKTGLRFLCSKMDFLLFHIVQYGKTIVEFLIDFTKHLMHDLKMKKEKYLKTL